MRQKKLLRIIPFVLFLPAIGVASPYSYAPAYASPSAAALGPWPWNFDIGGGPVPVAGSSHNQLNDGSSFTVGGGFNASPRTGFVIEFMNYRMIEGLH